MSGLKDSLLLTLASLHPEDRAWLLDNVSVEVRTQLVEVVGQASAPRSGHGTADASPSDAARMAIERADPATIVALLQTEPEWLVAAVLRAGSTAWRDSVVACWPTMALTGLPAIDAVNPIKPALSEAILTAMARRLPACADAARLGAPTFFGHLLSSLRNSWTARGSTL